MKAQPSRFISKRCERLPTIEHKQSSLFLLKIFPFLFEVGMTKIVQYVEVTYIINQSNLRKACNQKKSWKSCSNMNIAQNSKQIKTVIQAINIWILLENHVLFTYLYDIPYTIFFQHTQQKSIH